MTLQGGGLQEGGFYFSCHKCCVCFHVHLSGPMIWISVTRSHGHFSGLRHNVISRVVDLQFALV